MKDLILLKILPQIHELAKFFKFYRKKLAREVIVSLDEIDKKIQSLELENANSKFELENQKKVSEEAKELLKASQSNLEEFKTVHSILNNKFTLIGQILSAKPNKNKGYEKFKSLLENDFMTFANEESSLAGEARAILMLQSVERELELIINFPILFSKNIIAIGGGFSSGKSAFVNSLFLKKNIQLPIGIKPVTAIPTYVFSDTRNMIKGYTNNGGAILIEPEFYEKLSHDFIKSFNFNLREILPFIALSAPLDDQYFRDICLIDTPGYNPANSDQYTNDDKNTTQEYILQSNVLLWMIGLDTNGTISASDLSFLSEVDLQNKKLYIILNKAELRSQDEVESIIDEVEERLDDYFIKYEGISAYSATKRKEYSYRKKPLLEFLMKQNKKRKVRRELIENVDNVFKLYEEAIDKELNHISRIKNNLKGLVLDLLEIGVDSNDNKYETRITKINKLLDTITLKEHLEKAKKIKSEMILAVNEIFDSVESSV